MRRGVVLGLMFLAHTAYSQIGALPEPQFPSMQPVYSTSAYGNNNPAPAHPRQPRQALSGMTSRDIASKQPTLFSTVSTQQKRREVELLIEEVQRDEKRFHVMDENRAHASTAHFKRFDQALQHLNDMLSGKAPLSVADAYYTIEDAFGNNYLTRDAYKKIIGESVAFIKAWMVENRLNPKDNFQVHFAIQKFMSERLTIHKADRNKENKTHLETVEHHPFHYDYDDYQGAEDYRNLFVTKCLATGFGQCASLPGVYLVLAEGMGVKAYLSFAPQHSFIKYPDNNGYIVNYEPTSNWEISDKWYEENMFISAKAIRNGVYLDTLNTRQVIANCIFDLAVNYAIVDRTGKEDFILHCLHSGRPHFPKNNNLQPLFIYSMHLKTRLRDIMREKHVKSLDGIAALPEARKLYNEYMSNEEMIARLGYQDMPAGMYEEMLNQHEFKGKVQKKYNINSKDKRNLFTVPDQQN